MKAERRRLARAMSRMILLLLAIAVTPACYYFEASSRDAEATDAAYYKTELFYHWDYLDTTTALKALELDIKNTQTARARQPQVPAVPVIHSIEFPASIPADGTVQTGLVSFSDDDGDVTRMRMIVLTTSTDFQGADVTPVLVSGTRYKGAYRIRVWCYQPDTISLLVLLNDAQQNQSLGAPLTFRCK